MASPFGKASSPFATCTNNGFGGEVKTPFQQPAGQKGFGFGKFSTLAITGMESTPKNPFQHSKPFDDGSKTPQTKEGSSFLGHASTSSPFSFGISSSFQLEQRAGNQEIQKNPFQQSTPSSGEIIASRTSQTSAHSSNIHANAPFSTGKASPFAFISNEHNPFQQSKAVGGSVGLPSKNSQTTTGSLIFGHASTSPFSSGKSPPFASTGNDHESKNPLKQSIAGNSLASWTSQTMAGSSMQGNASSTSSFSFGKFSPFAISSNTHQPEAKNPFQNSTRDGNRSIWSQKEIVGSTKLGGGSPSFIAPFGQPARYQNPGPPFASGSGSESIAPSPSFRSLKDSKPDFGNAYTTPWTFSPSAGYGNLPSMENAECMEEETLISLSATPPYENISPEELRWEDYQAKKAVASQMTSKLAPSSPFMVPNMCNGAASSSNSQVFTPNSADSSTPVCKFCNNGGSLAPSLAMSSAGLNSSSFDSVKGTQSPSTSLSHATPASTPFSPALPFSGSQNQSQIVPPSPFGSSSSRVSSNRTMACPLQASSYLKGQLEKAFCLQWPQSSLQAPILSVPSPLTTITSSPSAAASVDQNISPERALAPAALANAYAVTSGMSLTLSNAESSSFVQHGISSLPDAGKYSQPRTISLLTSKQVFQKTVIRMQPRRPGSQPKKDGPRVSFLNDYNDPEDSRNRDAPFGGTEKSKGVSLCTPWLSNDNGALKGDSIKAM